MRPSGFSIGRFFGISLVFALPGLLGLGVLALDNRLAPVPAFFAAVAVFAGSGCILTIFFRDFVRISSFVDTLADVGAGATAPRPPPLRFELVRDFAAQITQLDRQWRKRVRKAERRLAASEGLIEAMQDPLLVVGPDRTIRRANATALALYGTRAMGRDLAETLRHPDLLAAVGSAVNGGGERTVQFSQPVPVERTFEGRVMPLADAWMDPVQSASGDTAPGTGALLTLHDISAIKRSEQMRADFVANASHELRTPLSTLIGFIETLRGPARDDSEARDRFLGIMEDQANRMSRLVQDLLSLSRIELDEHTRPTGRVDLGGVLNTVVDLLGIRAEERGISLVVDLPPDLPAVAGDDDQLTQVFQNLVDNAIKYGGADEAVIIRATAVGADGRTVSVSVIDRGVGIPRSHLPRLTERFYRVDPARSRAMGGTGLGLAIVKHILTRHGGRLSVDSAPGRGSTFTVHLPAAAGHRMNEAGTKTSFRDENDLSTGTDIKP